MKKKNAFKLGAFICDTVYWSIKMIDQTAWALIGQSLMKQSQMVKNSDADSAKIFATSDFFSANF